MIIFFKYHLHIKFNFCKIKRTETQKKTQVNDIIYQQLLLIKLVSPKIKFCLINNIINIIEIITFLYNVRLLPNFANLKNYFLENLVNNNIIKLLLQFSSSFIKNLFFFYLTHN